MKIYPNNTVADFKTKLPDRVELVGDWEVAMTEFTYPVSWRNMGSDQWFQLTYVSTVSSGTPGKRMQFGTPKIYMFEGHYSNGKELFESLKKRWNQFWLRHKRPITSADGGVSEFYPPESDPNSAARIRIIAKEENDEEGQQQQEEVDDLEDDDDEGDDRAKKRRKKRDEVGEASVTDERSDVNKRSPGITVDSHSMNIFWLERTNRIKISLFNRQYRLSMSEKLREMVDLEFDSDTFRSMETSTEVDVNRGKHSIFVYCDLVRDSIVGDIRAPLLRSLVVQGRYGDNVREVFNKPMYFPVKTNHFDTVGISIKSEDGSPVEFNSGLSSVVLHFRRVGKNFDL